MGIETVVEKDAVAILARTALRRLRDEIAEAAGRHLVLAREVKLILAFPQIAVWLVSTADFT